MSSSREAALPTTLPAPVLLALPARILYGWMLFFLPFQAAFVIDIGATVRLSYVTGGLALLFALLSGRLRHPLRVAALKYALAFLGVLTLSTVFTFRAELQAIEVAGIRGSVLRPAIQILQMVLMMGFMYLTLNQNRFPKDVDRSVRWILAGAGLAILYGLYETLALARGLPYLDIRNALNTDFTRGFREQGISFEGFAVPRARATFMEPLNFANYLLFALPLAYVALRRLRGGWRILSWAVLLAGPIAFLLTNSRGALLAAGAAALSLLLLVRSLRVLVRGTTRAAVLVVALAIAGGVVFTRLVPGLSLPRVLAMFTSRVTIGLDDPARVISDEAWQTFLANPILGVGFGNLPFYMPISSLGGAFLVDAPNAYLRLLAETGVIGTLLYMAFLISLLWGIARVARAAPAGELRWMGGAIYFALVADSVQRLSFVGIATDTHLWVLFGLAIALIRLGRASAAAPAHG